MKACLAFVGALFGRRQRAAQFSPNGHAVLEGWDKSPDEEILQGLNALKNRRVNHPRLFLYGISGPHQGEVFALGRGRERLSKDMEATVVLTPATRGEGAYQMLINGHITLTSDAGSYFRLNGREEESSEVYDYDEIDLMGNRFLMLEVNGSHTGVESDPMEER